MARDAEKEIWRGMWRRCTDAESTGYRNYGARGIIVCERWRSFDLFLADMGRRPSVDLSIDRIDNDGNYEPGNCRWATRKEQQRNRRTNRRITVDGRTQTLVEWRQEFGLSESLVHMRRRRGWTEQESIAPVGSVNHHARWLEHDGERHTIAAWAKRLGITRGALCMRLSAGWGVEKALSTHSLAPDRRDSPSEHTLRYRSDLERACRLMERLLRELFAERAGLRRAA